MAIEAIEVAGVSGPPLAEVKRRYLDAGIRLAAKPVHVVKDMYGVVVEKTHLNTGVGYIKSGWAWLTEKVSTGMHAVGWVGGLGTGLLAVSTNLGRKFINATVGTALRVTGSIIKTGFRWLQKGLRHLWAPGRMIAAALDTVVDAGKRAWSSVKGFWDRNISRHTKLHSVAMDSTRAVGTTMIGVKLALAITNPILAGIVAIGTAIYAGANALITAGATGMLGKDAQDTDKAIRATAEKRREERAAERAAKKAVKDETKATDAVTVAQEASVKADEAAANAKAAVATAQANATASTVKVEETKVEVTEAKAETVEAKATEAAATEVVQTPVVVVNPPVAQEPAVETPPAAEAAAPPAPPSVTVEATTIKTDPDVLVLTVPQQDAMAEQVEKVVDKVLEKKTSDLTFQQEMAQPPPKPPPAVVPPLTKAQKRSAAGKARREAAAAAKANAAKAGANA